MKGQYRNIVLCLITAVLLNVFIPVATYSYGDKYCSCCTGKKCHQNTKCHDTKDVCICKHQQIVQAVLPKAGNLHYRVFSGYLTQIPHFTYRYLSIDDTFHPPKV